MKLHKKAQASLEFLMTYGWVIIVILIALIVAWQWGLFSLGGTVKSGYSGFWGVVPTDFKYRSNGDLIMSLSNSVGADVNVTSIEAETGTQKYTTTNEIPISSGNNTLSQMLGIFPGSSSGSSYEIFISINYTDKRTGPDIHRSSGRLWGSVEA